MAYKFKHNKHLLSCSGLPVFLQTAFQCRFKCEPFKFKAQNGKGNELLIKASKAFGEMEPSDTCVAVQGNIFNFYDESEKREVAAGNYFHYLLIVFFQFFKMTQ